MTAAATSFDTVAVGVDGSPESVQAALWATREAGLRKDNLDLVLVNDDPVRSTWADTTLRHVAEQCRACDPDLRITSSILEGHPTEQLVKASTRADVLVLSAHSHHEFRDALLGSISTGVAIHGQCPVVVTRAATTGHGPILVGFDGSPGSDRALEFACEAAQRRHTEVWVMQVWHEEGLLTGPISPGAEAEIQERVEASLADQLDSWRHQYSQTAVRTMVQHGHPVPMLTDAARHAQLLVVGHRGSGGFNGLVLGSVAAGVVHHAKTPVAITHGHHAVVEQHRGGGARDGADDGQAINGG